MIIMNYDNHVMMIIMDSHIHWGGGENDDNPGEPRHPAQATLLREKRHHMGGFRCLAYFHSGPPLIKSCKQYLNLVGLTYPLYSWTGDQWLTVPSVLFAKGGRSWRPGHRTQSWGLTLSPSDPEAFRLSLPISLHCSLSPAEIKLQ